MTRRPGTWLVLAVLAALAASAIVPAPPDIQPALTRLAILTIGIVASWRLVRRFASATRSTPETFETDLRPTAAFAADNPGLRSADQTLRMALGSSFGVEFMLKPALRELARWRLLRIRGIDMDATRELARHTVGEPLWSLIEPGEPRPIYGAPGISLDEIEASLDQLEHI
jgi:hypothetical protein